MKVRTLVIAVLGVLLIPLMVGGIAVLGVAVQLPSGQASRVKGPHGVVGVMAQGSYAWVVPAGDGEVVIIDAGQDPSATALRAEVGSRKVRAILLTHAHSDSSAGVDAFPDAELVHGPGEGQLLRREALPKGWLASWLARSSPKPRLPESVVEATDGQELVFGPAHFRVTHVPGHTAGSVAYLWRDVVFVGDGVLVQPQWMLMPSPFSDDDVQAKASLGALLPLAFDRMVDARGGMASDARKGLASFLGVDEPEPPTVSVTDDAPAADRPTAERGEPETVKGVLAQTPLQDDRGLRPARLVLDDGRVFVLSEQPLVEHQAMWNRPVVVAGRAVEHPPGRSALSGPWFEIDTIGLVEGWSASEGPVERAYPTDWVRGQWVELTGVLASATPLAAGSTWAEGDLGPVSLTLDAREGRARIGERITVLGQVSQGGRQPHMTVRALCEGALPGCGTDEAPQAPTRD